MNKGEQEPYQVDLARTALVALARGGHIEEPPSRVQLAAVNYAIREDMSRTLIQGLEDGSGALWFDEDDRTLYYLLAPKAEGEERLPMAVARVPKRGPIRYL